MQSYGEWVEVGAGSRELALNLCLLPIETTGKEGYIWKELYLSMN